jgi:methylenetetrahydrofolate reductase (NADPH)
MKTGFAGTNGGPPLRVPDVYREGRFGLSIEIFPPKNPDGDDGLLKSLEQLTAYDPAFISCTYGAGGTTRERTLEWCQRIQDRLGRTATAHFTCVGATRDQLLEWLGLAEQRGIGNIMALRGDPPKGQERFEAVDGGLQHANELVSLIRQHFPEMGIGVAGYPEKHPEAADSDTDLQNLKRKVDAGADAVVTQLFYVNESFFQFRERYNQAGISIPLVPGIMPITEFARIQRIAAMCGAIFPPELASRLEAAQDDKQAQFEIGVEHAIGQCRELVDQGVPGIHFYVLNRSAACERILDALGMERHQADCA